MGGWPILGFDFGVNKNRPTNTTTYLLLSGVKNIGETTAVVTAPLPTGALPKCSARSSNVLTKNGLSSPNLNYQCKEIQDVPEGIVVPLNHSYISGLCGLLISFHVCHVLLILFIVQGMLSIYL